MMDLFIINMPLFTSQDSNRWTGVVWITCKWLCVFSICLDLSFIPLVLVSIAVQYATCICLLSKHHKRYEEARCSPRAISSKTNSSDSVDFGTVGICHSQTSSYSLLTGCCSLILWLNWWFFTTKDVVHLLCLTEMNHVKHEINRIHFQVGFRLPHPFLHPFFLRL